MEQMGLIEPHDVTGLGMWRDGLTDLAGSQPAISDPGIVDPCRAAIFFDDALVASLENLLPGQIHPTPVGSNVHHSLFRKVVPDAWVDPPIDSSTVGNGSLASVLGSLQAEEPN